MKKKVSDPVEWAIIITLIVLILGLLLIGRFARADETNSPPGGLKFFPVWERQFCGCPAGVEKACYTFEQAKTILKTDLDLQAKLAELDVLRQNLRDAKEGLDKLQVAHTRLLTAVSTVDERLTAKQQVLEEAAYELEKAKNRDILGGGLPWVVGIAVTFGVVGFVGGVLLSK